MILETIARATVAAAGQTVLWLQKYGPVSILSKRRRSPVAVPLRPLPLDFCGALDGSENTYARRLSPNSSPDQAATEDSWHVGDAAPDENAA